MRVIMLGPPGAGKGTQSELIASRYDVPHISSGEIFREEVARKSPLGDTLRGYLEAGDLVPDDLVLSLIMDRVADAAENRGGYVLDGFPRTVPQAEAAAGAAREAKASAQAVLYLDAPVEVLVDRLADRGEGRADDAQEVVRHRLEVYAGRTKPLLDYYSGRGLLTQIDAEPVVDTVSQQIFQALDQLDG
ncbi:MAG TPA: adenylate kinase [Trebonia sp.]